VVGTGDNGQPNSSTGSMAIPMTAGFDPIFPVHHANMDRLWMKWACMPNKTWGKLPDKAWFDESPWFFFGVDGKEINRPRKDYFDYRALGVSFKDEDPNCKPLTLPQEVVGTAVAAVRASPPKSQVFAANVLNIATPIVANVRGATTFSLLAAADKRAVAARNFDTVLAQASKRTDSVTLTLHDVDTIGATATGFDVYLVPETTDAAALTPQNPGYVGQINLFEHATRFDQSFDVTALLAGKQRSTASLKIVILPYSLSTEPKVAGAKIPFRTGAAQIGRISLTKSDGTPLLSPHRH
jgi:hypothetical protein